LTISRAGPSGSTALSAAVAKVAGRLFRAAEVEREAHEAYNAFR